MLPPTIQKLVKLFSKFPSVGPRTAGRFVFYLIKLSRKDFEELIKSLVELRKTVKNCLFCFNPFDSAEASEEEKLCPICRDKGRNRKILCLVEKESDLISIEKVKRYKGLYFILGNVVSALKKEDIEKIRIEELKQRIENPENFGLPDVDFQEVIIALNPTAEGEATGFYVERKLKENNYPLKITHLGRGLPTGGELEYADEETLSSAFEGRK